MHDPLVWALFPQGDLIVLICVLTSDTGGIHAYGYDDGVPPLPLLLVCCTTDVSLLVLSILYEDYYSD